MLIFSLNISILYLLIEDSINILILSILHVKTVPKEQWSASQQTSYSRSRGAEMCHRNCAPNELQEMEFANGREAHSGQRTETPLLFREMSWQGRGMVHALGRVSGVLLLPYSGSYLQCSIFLSIFHSISLYC